MDTSRTKRTATIIFIPSFLIILGMLLWKCRYGFPSDEALYLLVPMRFINGDIPLIHEWHPTQICYIWLQPVVALFLKINGGTEGIFLAFRYIFTAVWGLFSLFVFARLRKISPIGALLASLMIFIYVPFGEMALYYNTIGIITLLSSSVIVLTAQKWKPFQYMAAGALYAVAVTCCPFLALAFPVLIIIAIICKEKLFLFFTGGILVIFAVFCIYCLSKASLSDIIHSIPYLAGDREHPFSLTDKIATYFLSILTSSYLTPVFLALLLGPIALALCRKDSRTHKIGFVITVALTIAMQVIYLVKGSFFNTFMFAPMFIAVYCFITSKDKDIRRLFFMVWLPGLFYTVCLHMSSNLDFGAISSAASIPSVASVIIAVIYIREEFSTGDLRKISIAVFAALIAFQLSVETYMRITYIFSENTLSNMTDTADKGAMKGLISTGNRIFYYEVMLYELKPLIESDADKVLIMSPESWMYLEVDKAIGSYTCWSPLIDDYTVDLLEEYYGMYPDMKPDMIYVEPYYTDLVPRLASLGYTEQKTALGGYVLS